MNPQTFIQSGLLEAYVLGLASPSERAEVEQMAATHPEVQQELTTIERSLEAFAQARGEAPPNWMKGRILERLDESGKVAPAPTVPATLVSTFGFMHFLALAFGLATLAFGYLYWQELTARRTLENDLSQVRQEVADCRQRSEESRQRNLLFANQLKMLRDPDTRTVQMTDGKAYQVYTYINPVRQTVAIDLSTMPAAPPNKHIQFWILDAKGTPISMGMVQDQGDWQEFAYHSEAVRYAISAEDSPHGSPQPTVVLAISG